MWRIPILRPVTSEKRLLVVLYYPVWISLSFCSTVFLNYALKRNSNSERMNILGHSPRSTPHPPAGMRSPRAYKVELPALCVRSNLINHLSRTLNRGRWREYLVSGSTKQRPSKENDLQRKFVTRTHLRPPIRVMTFGTILLSLHQPRCSVTGRGASSVLKRSHVNI